MKIILTFRFSQNWAEKRQTAADYIQKLLKMVRLLESEKSALGSLDRSVNAAQMKGYHSDVSTEVCACVLAVVCHLWSFALQNTMVPTYIQIFQRINDPKNELIQILEEF